jgi:hypothetical protein
MKIDDDPDPAGGYGIGLERPTSANSGVVHAGGVSP